MALKLLQSHVSPLGQFDVLDTELASFKGGEVCTLRSVTYKGTDTNTPDVNDGYSGVTSKARPAVTLTLVSGNRPLFLADEGTSGYGTLFGQVVGGTGGQVVTGANLGPHTAVASGKMTLWNEPGLYGVTLDAVDATSGTGLVPTNTTLAIGDPIYATAAGKLTPDTSKRFENYVVARFVEFATTGSLVTTGAGAVAPGVIAAAGGFSAFTQAVVHFFPGV